MSVHISHFSILCVVCECVLYGFSEKIDSHFSTSKPKKGIPFLTVSLNI